MRLIINILLILGVAGLFYVLYNSIQEPISFQEAKSLQLHEVRQERKAARGNFISQRSISYQVCC